MRCDFLLLLLLLVLAGYNPVQASRYPTKTPTRPPTFPTSKPTVRPTRYPKTAQPSAFPTRAPRTFSPTRRPKTLSPTSKQPTTSRPTVRTKRPTALPTKAPKPTQSPSALPTTGAPNTAVPTSPVETSSPTTQAPVQTSSPTTHAPVTYRYAPTYISPQTIKDVTRALNGIRGRVGASDMIRITHDPKLTAILTEFRDTMGSPWMYESTTKTENHLNALPPPFVGQNVEMKHLRRNEVFLNISRKYGMEEEITNNYQYAFHDTYITKIGIKRIIQHRGNQAHCLQLDRCEKDRFNNFLGCSKHVIDEENFDPPPYLAQLREDNCDWWWWYYPWMTHSKAYKYGIVALGINGRFVEFTVQDNSFLLLLMLDVPDNKPVNNIPYKKGKACSACPARFPNCNQGMCVA